MSFLLVVKAELVRNFIIMRRYWFRTVIGLTLSYGLLSVMIYGFISQRGVVNEHMGGKLSNPEQATMWALGFIIGAFASGVVGMFSQGLQELARSGQLEQLCMSPHGLVTNFLARSVVSAISNILSSAVLIWLIARTFGGALHADFLPTVVLLTFTFANLLGFGFFVGGLVLVFKQTGQIAMIVRMGLFLLAIIATDKIAEWPTIAQWGAHAVPITDAAICIKYVLIQGQMLNGEHVSVFAHPSFMFLVINCVLSTIIGMTCFRMMENWSRGRGTLGAY